MTAVLVRQRTPAAAPAKPAPVAGAWRRLSYRCALAPAVVLAPLIALAPTGDQRTAVYAHGATVRNNPWTLVTDNVGSIGTYLDLGNFRPLGRIAEWALDVAAYLMVEFLHLPAGIALRLVALLAVVLCTAAAVVFAEALTARGRMFAARPARPIALIPFAMAGCLVAAGPAGPVVVFGGVYFLSAAVALLVAVWLCRVPTRPGLLIAAGAALAGCNEVAALGVPLAAVAVLARHRLVLGLPSRMRPVLWLCAGFLPVFLPIRLIVLLGCRAGDCYRGTEAAPGGALAELPNRLTAWLPPLQWVQALQGAGRPTQVVLGLTVVAVFLLVRRTMRELGGLTVLDRRQAQGLGVAGGALVVLGAVLGALSARGQEVAAAGGWGIGWRDSAVTAAGGALLLCGLAGLRCRADLQRLALGGLAALLVGSAAANQAYAVHTNRQEAALVDNGIAHEVVNFDATDAGDARRCALRDRYSAAQDGLGYDRFSAAEAPGTTSPTSRLDLALDMATVQMYGVVYCRRPL